MGQKVATLVDFEGVAGSYSVVWDGRDDDGGILPNGVHFYRIAANGFAQTRKLSFMR